MMKGSRREDHGVNHAAGGFGLTVDDSSSKTGRPGLTLHLNTGDAIPEQQNRKIDSPIAELGASGFWPVRRIIGLRSLRSRSESSRSRCPELSVPITAVLLSEPGGGNGYPNQRNTKLRH